MVRVSDFPEQNTWELAHPVVHVEEDGMDLGVGVIMWRKIAIWVMSVSERRVRWKTETHLYP